MIKINIPDKITDSLALDLLEQVLPEELTSEDVTNFDFMGKDAIIKRGDYKEGFVYKTVAALGYEDLEDIRNVAYCYSRASTNALKCNLPLAANVCVGRALSICPYLLLENEEARYIEKEMSHYLIKKIATSSRIYKKLYKERKPKRFNEYEHNWFTIDRINTIFA